MRVLRFIISVTVLLVLCFSLRAQQYSGMRGLRHVPTAEMDSLGTFRLGTHFIHKNMMPDVFAYSGSDGLSHKYNSFSYYFGATPLKWFSASYTCVMIRRHEGKGGFQGQDRQVSAKIRVFDERRFIPAIVVGAQDLLASSLKAEESQNRFANFYAAASKHFDISGSCLGVHAVYRYYLKDFNKRYEGIAGGLTFVPSFAPSLRASAEWDGCHFNASLDALVLKHFLFQLSLEDCRYLTGGFCWVINLL